MNNSIKYIALEELADFVRGPFGGSLKKNDFVEEGYAVYEQQHAINNQFNDIRYFIDEDKFASMKRFEVNENDLIMSCSGTMGKVAVVPKGIKKGIINQALLKITPSRKLNVRFLEYYMQSSTFQFFLNKGAKGAAIKNVASVKELKKIPFPDFDFNEQQKIVEKLDKAFELIDQAKANIEQNIINAKELFQSKLDEVFSQKGDGWKENKLTELSKITYGCTEKALQEDTGIKYLRITDINNGEVHWHEVPFCKLSTSDEVKYRLTDGDIVFARTGATTGKSFIYHDEVNSVYASYLIRLQVSNTHKINPDFVYWYFQSGEYWRIIRTGMTGSTLGGFNAKKLGEIILHYPENVDVQKHLIDEFVSLQDETNRIINLYNVKLSNLEELRKSILEKAFKGELTNLS